MATITAQLCACELGLALPIAKCTGCAHATLTKNTARVAEEASGTLIAGRVLWVAGSPLCVIYTLATGHGANPFDLRVATTNFFQAWTIMRWRVQG